MIKRWKGSLAAQFILFTLSALIVAQGMTFLISWNEHAKTLNDVAKSEFFSRARSVTRLMEAVAPVSREQALSASETSESRFWLSDAEVGDASAWRLQAAERFSQPFENYVDLTEVFTGTPAIIDVPDQAEVAAANVGEDWREPMQELWALPQPVNYVYFDGQRGYGLQIHLNDGHWLNAAFYLRDTGGWWTSTSLASLALTAIILALIAVFIASRIARPLRHLAKSAEALGRGENLPPLPEEGPQEVRRTAEAFNRMQARLHRFVEDRTTMLAAVGHDLRTALTSLRLRAEFLSDLEIKRKMLGTIAELEGMTEAAIVFARGESTAEDTRALDLEALVGSICGDLEDLGQPVTHIEGPRLTYRCRPSNLRRAVRNLVENAVRYGGEATVSIRQTVDTIDIVVEDRGPGIPLAMQERVFAPFFRLEGSRNQETGGFGLGLAIARAVVRQHGGDISFVLKPGGMQTIVSLPREVRSEVKAMAVEKTWRLHRQRLGRRALQILSKIKGGPHVHRYARQLRLQWQAMRR